MINLKNDTFFLGVGYLALENFVCLHIRNFDRKLNSEGYYFLNPCYHCKHYLMPILKRPNLYNVPSILKFRLSGRENNFRLINPIYPECRIVKIEESEHYVFSKKNLSEQIVKITSIDTNMNNIEILIRKSSLLENLKLGLRTAYISLDEENYFNFITIYG